MLRTRRWQVSCGAVERAICELCGEEEESIEHVVLSCPRLAPQQPSGVSLEQALGFGQTGPSGGAAATSDGRDREAVTAIIDRTKRRLEVWRSRTMAWVGNNRGGGPGAEVQSTCHDTHGCSRGVSTRFKGV
ncbi:hypothetical protein HPB48_020101 [Haemaphysalis longicornis]|uniref:Uncharacterized protein n=1 Tax=Haemaphysalis longicornis TaxID=44386 RepID=A0A9J6FLS4_HAELO|nr:hypothetical protein HPB48_020101 [Haemaphysalis longicornis]